jgi:electron transport complex protein RnfB
VNDVGADAPARDRVDAIDALLPQTQCTRCGFAGCRPYAEALADGRSDIDRCPPGGAAGVARLAAFLGRPVRPLDPACGVETPASVALVDESVCIGCTLCLQVCPVDAIVGAAKRMHTVIADECNGCALCIAPCPVDCITIETIAARQAAGAPVAPRRASDWQRDAERWRRRMHVRRARLARARAERDARLDGRQAVIEAALARARARREAGR